MHRVLMDLLTFMGLSSGSSRWYLFWSGIGSGSPVIAGVFLVYRHHRCHDCWRISVHTDPASGAKYCHKHRRQHGGNPQGD